MATKSTDYREPSVGAVTVTVMAATFMILIGSFHIIEGIVALANDEFYVVGQEYIFKFDLTTWGWIHILLALVVLFAGISLFQGRTWARTVAVIVAAVSILANFLWMPYYPIWSLTIIAFNVFVIWAVTAHGRDITRV